ncbi:hypothetical protein P6144_14330 [Sphingomonas sp. HITSZ_GF]|uniref:hypothetical protein n=1 Tax=Sphingomonas sp. HITSZ_GF TaxID=3037247 RepID=UPI00240E69A1|nr:hypothetical protein [Sphingomonas sp. HITSZ_GF]MDG2534833.1 hypothetical protein [Sphingomonas sp. HITSZ_GF]
MATLAEPMPMAARRDRFFLILSLAMIAVIVGGFSLNIVAGRSSFGLPLIYHVHALVFMGWIAIYLMQTLLVAGGNVAIHRQLGWIALAWVPAMLVMGMAITLYSVCHHGGPPFFALPEFLFGNPAGLLCFGGLALAGFSMRKRSDWHRRLMLCSMAAITGPGFGRLLPVPFMIPWSWFAAALVAPLIFPLIGAARDWMRSGRVHPAWLWGIAAMAGSFAVAEALAFTPLGEGIARAVVAGTPGADRPFAAHWPPAPVNP